MGMVVDLAGVVLNRQESQTDSTEGRLWCSHNRATRRRGGGRRTRRQSQQKAAHVEACMYVCMSGCVCTGNAPFLSSGVEGNDESRAAD